MFMATQGSGRLTGLAVVDSQWMVVLGGSGRGPDAVSVVCRGSGGFWGGFMRCGVVYAGLNQRN